MAISIPLWLYLSAPSVNRVLLTKSMRLLCCWFVYATYFSRPSCQSVTDAGQSKCRVERNQALEQARRPQESMFIPECNEDGTFAQVRLAFCWIYSLIQEPAHVYKLLSSLSVMYLSASAGPVSHSDRLLLVCHEWRQASEWLLCAQQDPGVFRYWWESILKTCGWNVQSFSKES